MKVWFVILPFIGLNAFAQSDVSIETRVTYDLAKQEHKICGTLETTNQHLRSDQFGELTARATLTTKTTVWVATYSEEEVPANGKSPAWDAFYGASSRSERISALKRAIKGIGEATAPLVEPYFYGEGIKKPKSWKEFSDRIRLAGAGIEYKTCSQSQDGCIRASSWISRVLNQYAEDNRENLGYSRSVVSVALTPQTRETSSPVPGLNKKFSYVVRFEGLALLPDECEVITVSYDGISLNAKAATAYNHLAVSKASAENWRGRDAVILVNSQGRRQIGPPKLANIANQGSGFVVTKSPLWERYSTNRVFASQCIATATGTVSATEKRAWYDHSHAESKQVGTCSVTLSSDCSPQYFDVNPVGFNPQTEKLSYSGVIRFNATCPFFNTSEF